MTNKDIFEKLAMNVKFLIDNLTEYILSQNGYMKIHSSDAAYLQFSIGTNVFILDADIQPYDGLDSVTYLNTYRLLKHDSEHPPYKRHAIPDLQIFSDAGNNTMFQQEQQFEVPARFGKPNTYSTKRITNAEFGETYCNVLESWLKNNRLTR